MEKEISKQKNNNNIQKIHLFFSVIILLWLNVGTFTYVVDYIPSYAKIFIYLLWLTMSILSDKKFGEKLIKNISFLILYIIVICISLLFSNNINNLSNYLSNFLYLLIIVSITTYYLDKNEKNLKIILYILLFDIIYVGINTIHNLNINPSISRILSTDLKNQQTLLGKNRLYAIGSYSYIYSIIMLLLVLVGYTSNNKKKNITIINIALIIFFSMIIIKAQFTIALFFTIIFSIKVILENKIHNKKILILILPIIIGIIVIVFPFMINKLLEVDNMPTIIRERIVEISKAINGNDMKKGDFSLRREKYNKSIESFKKNIFIGSFGENTVRRTFYFY